MPDPQTQVHWVDTAGNQQGPEPWDTVVARVRAGQIPPGTQVWWDGAPGWQAFDQVPGTRPRRRRSQAPAPAGSTPIARRRP